MEQEHTKKDLIKPETKKPTYARPKKKLFSLKNLMKYFNWFDSIEENDIALDTRSADSHANSTARKELKNISRRETANNGHLKGISRSYSNDIVGSGPRIQITDERFDQDERVIIGKAFNNWLNDIRFAKKLRLQVKAGEFTDGEGFGYIHPVQVSNQEEFSDNDCYYRNPVGLDYRVVECDRFTDDDAAVFGASFGNVDEEGKFIDGIQYDENGYPKAYRMLRRHPGDSTFYGQAGKSNNEKYIDIPAKYVIHLFQEERAEQRRGVPQNQASLNLAKRLRSYRDAFVTAMWKAATIGGYLSTDLEPVVDTVYDENGDPELDDFGNIKTEIDCPEAGDSFEARPDEVQCLPRGYKYQQHETPTVANTHKEFMDQGVTEMGREVCMPRHKSTGDSSNYNFASVRNDGLDWRTFVKIERSNLSWEVGRLFIIWWEFAQNNQLVLPTEIQTKIIADDDLPLYPAHIFHWDGLPHVDPTKQANSQLMRLRMGEINMYDLHAENGENWDEKLEASARALRMEPEEYLEKICNYIWQPPNQPSQEASNTESIEQKLNEALNEIEILRNQGT